MSEDLQTYIKGETKLIHYHSNRVNCPICNQICPIPEETVGATSWASAMAKLYTKHWVSICQFLDLPEHDDAHILWNRIRGGDMKRWTRLEISTFKTQLKILREKIANKRITRSGTHPRLSEKLT